MLKSIQERGSTLSGEILGGLTTFSAMSYILAVNPSILATTGMDSAALLTSTAIISAFSTLCAGLWMNFPIAMAPGMGLNAYFAFTLCGGQEVHWQAALTVVFVSGIIFFILSLSGMRSALVAAFPPNLRSGISAGIGAFLLFLGLQNSGIVIEDPATLVKGISPFNLKAWIIFVATIVGLWLVNKNIPGSLLIVILLVSGIGILIPSAEDGGTMTQIPEQFFSIPASIEPVFWKFDWGFLSSHAALFIQATLTFLIVDIFDTTGTLVGIGQRAGVINKHGQWKNGNKAMKVDAASTFVGAALGMSPVTSYIESSAGIESGAKTGLASLVTSICFILALWFSPIILAIPKEAAGVALIIVGILMLQSLKELNFSDINECAAPLVCVFMIPMSFSISYGIALGYLSYFGLHLLPGGQRKNFTVVHYILAVVFILLLLV